MSIQQKNTSRTNANQEKEIARYLRDTPDFFERHMDILADMILPHESGKAISLIERQVSVLRDQKEDLKKRFNRLIENARENELLVERINALVLRLLDTESLDDVLTSLRAHLLEDFDADAVVIRLFNPVSEEMARLTEFVDWSEPVMGAFEKVIKGRKPICGRLKHGQLDSLFSEDADDIGSAALIPLLHPGDRTGCYGLLAIGSKDSKRFGPEMGVMFLEHLGSLVSRVLKTYLG